MICAKNAILASLVMALTACGSDDGGTETRTISMNFSGLESLGEDFVYEGWLLVDGDAISSGRFDINSAGMPEPATFEIDESVADVASTFVLTIEPRTGDDPAPAPTHVVAGEIANGTANLSVEHPGALGTDFASATGSFLLATPTSAEENDDSLGIWWLDPTGPSATLDLPTLPAGWVYEGWVVGETGPISTGRFTSSAGVDSDAAGPDAGVDGCTTDNMCPAYPGQDFIDPALDLVGLAAVVSVEPEPDDSPAPFALKPLIDSEIENVAKPATQTMANLAGNNPTGTVSLE